MHIWMREKMRHVLVCVLPISYIGCRPVGMYGNSTMLEYPASICTIPVYSQTMYNLAKSCYLLLGETGNRQAADCNNFLQFRETGLGAYKSTPTPDPIYLHNSTLVSSRSH
ncbi:hypothetical protein F4823DRAFT_609289 [Ustulina deusta]|nr:hypothetical protein F4823DRAFT_609289 [Ustulina deusta]